MRLSRDQAQALLAFHDAYMVEYHALQREALGPATAQLGRAWSAASNNDISAGARAVRRALHRIADLDERFFDDLAGIVTADRHPSIQRARLHRERDRSRRTFLLFMGFTHEAAALELGEMLRTLPATERLTGDQFAIMDDAVLRYEEEITHMLGRLSAQGFQSLEDINRGGEAGQPADPFARMGAVQAEQATAIRRSRELARRTAQQIANDLGEPHGSHLRLTILTVVHSEIRSIASSGGLFDAPYLARIAADTIDEPAERETLIDAAAHASHELHALVDRAVASIEELDRLITRGAATRNHHRQHTEELTKLGSAADCITEDLERAIRTAIGDDWRQRIFTLTRSPLAPAPTPPPAPADAGPVEHLSFPDWTLPVRMTRQDLRAVLRLIGRGAAHAEIDRGIIDRYIEEAATLRIAARLREVLETARRTLPNQLVDAPTPEEIAKLLTLLADLRSADLRNRAPRLAIAPVMHDPGSVALLPMLLRIGDLHRHIDRLMPALETYLPSVNTVIQEVLTNGIGLAHAMELQQRSVGADIELTNKMAQFDRRLRTHRRVIRTAMRALIQSLTDSLPPPIARDLKHSYHQHAYPMALGMTAGFPVFLEQARTLDSLTVTQRSELDNLLTDHHSIAQAHADSIMQTVNELADWDVFHANQTEQHRALIALQTSLARHQEEHRQRLHRTHAALRLILDEAQHAALGPAPPM